MSFTSRFRLLGFTLVLGTGFAAAAAAETAPSLVSECIATSGDYVTRGKAVTYVITLENKCEQRLKCIVDAYVVGAKGPASGHTTMILAPQSQGAAAKKSYAMKVKAAGGMAQLSRDCKQLSR